MNKLCVFFIIAVFISNALGQQDVFFGQNFLPSLGQQPRQNQVSAQETSGTTTTTQSPVLRSCIASCPTTPEYNPVCGTDNVTYNNPGRLSCAQACGVNVRLLRASRCPT